MVHVILEINLGYRIGSFGERLMVVENALQSTVASFKFLREHHDKLIRYKKTRFGSPIFRGVWDTIFSKVKRSGKNVGLNKEVLGANLKQFQQHIHHWTSLY